MANFAITNSTAVGGGKAAEAIGTSFKSMIFMGNSSATSSLTGAGNFRRGKIYDILVGTIATPADNFLVYDVTRITLGATVSGSSQGGISSISSGLGLDLADAFGFVNYVAINSSAEAGIAATNELWMVGINQRASYRWVAAPGSEFVWPATSSATTSNGMAIRANSSGGGFTSLVSVNCLWQEQ